MAHSSPDCHLESKGTAFFKGFSIDLYFLILVSALEKVPKHPI